MDNAPLSPPRSDADLLSAKCDIARRRLQAGLMIPAHPLALNARRKLDECRQRALTRYYLAAGAGGLAVGVHTTQFAIRKPGVGLYRPVLELAIATAREMVKSASAPAKPPFMVAGVLGSTAQAEAEAALARDLGYDAVLLSLASLNGWREDELIAHCRAIGRIMPVIGFYLQPAAGGIRLPYRFWRRFAGIESVVGIKIAPFNRYHTLDVLRGVADAGRSHEIALYTGNDDSIVHDLLTPFAVCGATGAPELRIVGGLLGHWAVWTRAAVNWFNQARILVQTRQPVPQDFLRLAYQVTDCNAAFFDAANDYRGCIAGLHEVLRRQGLLEGVWCIDPAECLSPGQTEEIDRVYAAYAHLNDDAFVAAHRDEWLRA